VTAEADADGDLDARIIDPADRAIALAPDDMRAYVAKSYYLALAGRASEALGAADAGLATTPNSAPLLDAWTLAQIVLGHFEQAKSDAEQAMRLSPRDPELPTRLMNSGMAELGSGISTPLGSNSKRRSTPATTRSYPTRIWRPPIRSQASGLRRMRRSQMLAVSIPTSPSSGWPNTRRLCLRYSRACARPGWPKNEAGAKTVRQVF
jgi:tetratricopeptide (TPR) repeat protein